MEVAQWLGEQALRANKLIPLQVWFRGQTTETETLEEYGSP